MERKSKTFASCRCGSQVDLSFEFATRVFSAEGVSDLWTCHSCGQRYRQSVSDAIDLDESGAEQSVHYQRGLVDGMRIGSEKPEYPKTVEEALRWTDAGNP